MFQLFAKNNHSWSARASSNWTLTKGGTDYHTPASADILLANGATITVDETLTAAEIRNDATGGATAGGGFTCAGNNIYIVSNIWAGSTTTACMTYSAAAGNTLYVTGNITGGSAATVAYGLNNSSAGTVIIGTVGNPQTVTGGTGAATSYGVNNASTGVITLYGACNGGNGTATAHGINNTSAGIINVTGTVTGGSGAATNYGIGNSTTGTINVLGNVTGGSGATTAHGINNTAYGTINVTGTAVVCGGSSTSTGSCHGINLGNGTINIGTVGSPGGVIGGSGTTTNYGVAISNGTLTVYGSVTGGAGATNAFGVHVSGSGTYNQNGTMQASTTAPAVSVAVTTASVRLAGIQLCAENGVPAVYAQRWFFNAASVQVGTYIALSLDGSTNIINFLSSGAGWNAYTTNTAIAAAVRSELAVELGRIDAEVSSRLAAAAYTAPANPANSAIAAAVRSDLATELARLDAAISSRMASYAQPAGFLAATFPATLASPTNITAASGIVLAAGVHAGVTVPTVTTLTNAPSVPTAAAIAAQVRTELALELGRLDVAASTRLAAGAYTAPDNAGIAALPTLAEILSASGGISAETAAKLDAAGQILLASPHVPSAAPVMVIPAPDSDEALTTAYAYTESITNVARAGIAITFRLAAPPAKSERLLEIAPKTMTTDALGYAQITLQRGLAYHVISRELGLDHTFTPATELFDLLTLIP